MVTIQIEVGTLTHALKLYKILAGSHISLLDLKLLSVPADGICQVNDIFSECLIAIECIRQRHLQPMTIIVVGSLCLSHIAHLKAPGRIEIKLLSLCSDNHTCHQHQINNQ